MNDFNQKYEPKDPAWIIEEKTSAPEKRNLYEALFCQANGYFGMRGINEDMPEGSRPGTYLAGIFDKSECVAIEWVNLPNPISFHLVLDGSKVDLASAEIVEHRRKLDLAHGAIFRETIFRTGGGRLTRFRSLRFVCRDLAGAAAMKVEITPLNYSAEISAVTELDGGVTNAFGSYFPDEKIKHFALCRINDNFEPETFLQVKTRDRGIAVGFLAFTEPALPPAKFRRIKKVFGEKAVEELRYPAEENRPMEFIRYVTVADSRDVPAEKQKERLAGIMAGIRASGFDRLWRDHCAGWKKRWQEADVVVATDAGADDRLHRRIRFNLYQLLTNGSEKRADHGIGIKGFTGEMYRGHYFWDTEMYLFPFFLYTNPKIACNLLVFRHSTLPKARQNARRRGFKGALFVWESDNEGNEGINPDINRATGEKRRRETLDQFHINLDVIYALFSYWRATGDEKFMLDYGAEILIENCRFWESKLEYNQKLDCYETLDIMGPDEYHAHAHNNYYTNYLLRFCLRETLRFFDGLKKKNPSAFRRLARRLKIRNAEFPRWRERAEKILLLEPKNGVLEQFSGYFRLRDHPIDRYNEFGIPVIDELEPLKSPSHPKYTPTLTHYHEALVKFARTVTLIKQADAVLILNLFPHDFPEEIKQATLAYYEPRTLHYSSLSPGIYALAAARLGEEKLAWKHFDLSLRMDLDDVKHESARALHTPTSGEVYTILVNGFAGLFPNGDVLELDPHLPAGWKSISFKFLWKGCCLEFMVGKNAVSVRSAGKRTVKISLRRKEILVKPGKKHCLAVGSGSTPENHRP